MDNCSEKHSSYNRYLFDFSMKMKDIGIFPITLEKVLGNGYATGMRTAMKYAVEEMNITEISTAYAAEKSGFRPCPSKIDFSLYEVSYECNGGDIVTVGRYCSYKVG